MKQPRLNKASKNILWVNADRHDLQLMQEVLRVYRSGFDIRAVSGIDAAVAYLQGVGRQGAPPCLIVQELQDRDGYATLAPLRHYATANGIPVVLLTDDGTGPPGMSAAELDGITVLPKPSTYDTLKVALQAILHLCDRSG